MKKFVRNCLLFALISAILCVLLEVLLLFKVNTYSYKRSYVESHLDDIECLLLGNSYIEEGLDPSVMGEGVFNMAISGRDLEYDVKLAERYIPVMPSLKTVIVPLDYRLFGFGRAVDNPEEKKNEEDLSDTYRCMYYKYMNIHTGGFWNWSEVLNSKYNYVYRLFQSDDVARECDPLGYIPLSLSKKRPDWQYRALPRLMDMSKPINESEKNLLLARYRKIAETACAHNCRLVMIRPPMYKTYNEAMEPEVNEEISCFISSLQEEFPCVEYYNYNNDGRFVEDDFFDAGHLSDHGAEKFSRIVREEILNLPFFY
ncbi:MAG: hypothetical protein IJS02_02855 [Bacteroidales bacterium]|nr:hypothetical protein [Bacteroidales bacterium]